MIHEDTCYALLLSNKFMVGFMLYSVGWHWKWTRPNYHCVLSRLPSTRNNCSNKCCKNPASAALTFLDFFVGGWKRIEMRYFQAIVLKSRFWLWLEKEKSKQACVSVSPWNKALYGSNGKPIVILGDFHSQNPLLCIAQHGLRDHHPGASCWSNSTSERCLI